MSYAEACVNLLKLAEQVQDAQALDYILAAAQRANALAAAEQSSIVG